MASPLHVLQVKLCCDEVWHGGPRGAAKHQSRALPETPLSLLARTFGGCPGAPWFNEGVEIDSRMESELHGYLPARAHKGLMRRCVQIYGDGRGRLDPERSLVWGLTGYEQIGGTAVKLRTFSRPEKRELASLFNMNRLSRSSPPYKPVFRRVDSAWAESFLLPLSVVVPLDPFAAVFFDLWFNSTE
jgi:hypothetical protein